MIVSFGEDRNGILWIGTWSDGLNRYDPIEKLFSYFKHDPHDKNSISSNVISTIYEDRSEKLWIGTWEGGLNYLVKKRNYFININYIQIPQKNISARDINSIYEDSSGIYWLGTSQEGLIRCDFKNKSFHQYKFDTESQIDASRNRINIIYEDSYGKLWLGTERFGLLIFDRKKAEFKWFSHKPSDPHSLNNNDILGIHQDNEGNLWIGTHGGGLNKYNYKENDFLHYKEKDGLPNNVVYGILEDDSGNLWLSTNKGISKFNPETKIFRNYDLHDGLQSNEFNSGAYFKNKKGEMYFGGVNGFNYFHPDSIRDDSTIVNLAILDLKINNMSILPQHKYEDRIILEKSIFETENLEFYHTDNIITFEFAALHFASPSKNQHAYMLEGFDKEWNYIGNRRFATYTNLPSGKYKFKVKGSNHDGVWNNNAK